MESMEGEIAYMTDEHFACYTKELEEALEEFFSSLGLSSSQ